MHKDTVKYFIFYDSAYPSVRAYVHYNSWADALGERQPVYTDDDIKKLYPMLSATQIKRVETMRCGTSLKLHDMHRNGDLMLKRLDEETAELLLKREGVKAAIDSCRNALEARCPDIFESLRCLEKDAREIDGKIKKLDFSK